MNERFHAIYLWAVAADRDGRVEQTVLQSYHDGTLLYELSKCRRTREDIIPFSRGGPIGVRGHSWLVKKLFGVVVYSKENKGA